MVHKIKDLGKNLEKVVSVNFGGKTYRELERKEEMLRGLRYQDCGFYSGSQPDKFRGETQEEYDERKKKRYDKRQQMACDFQNAISRERGDGTVYGAGDRAENNYYNKKINVPINKLELTDFEKKVLGNAFKERGINLETKSYSKGRQDMLLRSLDFNICSCCNYSVNGSIIAQGKTGERLYEFRIIFEDIIPSESTYEATKDYKGPYDVMISEFQLNKTFGFSSGIYREKGKQEIRQEEKRREKILNEQEREERKKNKQAQEK